MTDGQVIEEAVRLVDDGVSVTLPVNGRSMLPFIIGGRDSVILQKPVNLHVGNVVLAWTDDSRWVVHRIIHIDGDRITLMGRRKSVWQGILHRWPCQGVGDACSGRQGCETRYRNPLAAQGSPAVVVSATHPSLSSFYLSASVKSSNTEFINRK